MHRTPVGTRIVAGLSTLAIAAGSVVLLAPTASAAAQPATLVSATPTTIYVGANDQAAGDWTVTIPGNIADDDVVTIRIDDFDTTDDNCTGVGDTVAFSALPTVTMAGGDTAAFSATLGASGANCPGAGINNQLTLTANAADATGATVTLSGLKYNVGVAVEVGLVSHSVNSLDLVDFTVVGSNAAISNVRVDSGAPATLLTPTGSGQAIPNVVLSELAPAAIPALACITLASPTTASFTTTGTPPSVTASNGDGTATVLSVISNVITLDIGTASTDPTDFTISGIRVDGGGGDGSGGPLEAVAYDCSSPLQPYSIYEQLAFFGQVLRTAGTDRYDTAAKLAAEEFTGLTQCLNGKSVIVARGDNFPDALAASYLAGQNDVPILLTLPTSLSPQTATALAHHGVTNVTLVGGTSAISDGVATTIDNTAVSSCGTFTPTEGQTIAVTRVFGADRYATARAVAEAAGAGSAGTADTGFDGANCAPVKTAIVASGENFPDALAAGGLANGGLDPRGGLAGVCGTGPLPLLLTAPGSLSPATSAAIGTLGITQVIVVGGEAAVSTTAANAIDAISGVSVVRVGGADRQTTAALLAARIGLDNQGGYNTVFLVARPDTFPDALAASVRSGRNGWPMYLAASPTALGDTSSVFIVFHSNTALYYAGVLVGGTSALSDAVRAGTATAIASQFEPPAGPPVT